MRFVPCFASRIVGGDAAIEEFFAIHIGDFEEGRRRSGNEGCLIDVDLCGIPVV
jgi:hypothetical protein